MPTTLCSIHERISQCNADEWDEISGDSRAEEFFAGTHSSPRSGRSLSRPGPFRARDCIPRSARRRLREFLCFPDRFQLAC